MAALTPLWTFLQLPSLMILAVKAIVFYPQQGVILGIGILANTTIAVATQDAPHKPWCKVAILSSLYVQGSMSQISMVSVLVILVSSSSSGR